MYNPLDRRNTNALSFYRSKIILDRPNYFGWVRIVLDGSNSYGRVQIIIISPEKLFGPDQNNLDMTKTIWTVQNHFGSIKGQGINTIMYILKTSWKVMKKHISGQRFWWKNYYEGVNKRYGKLAWIPGNGWQYPNNIGKICQNWPKSVHGNHWKKVKLITCFHDSYIYEFTNLKKICFVLYKVEVFYWDPKCWCNFLS